MDNFFHQLRKRLRPGGRPVHDIIDRNQANCSGYARLYLERPNLFKWVGASIFSCHRVGMMLALYDLIVTDGKVTAATPGLSFGDFLPTGVRDHVCEQLDWIRKANNDIFDQVAPAHHAYLAGGLAQVEEECAGKDGLVESFRLLDRAERARDDDLVWQSQTLLGQYEQREILQPCFDQLGPSMRLVLSAFGWMDFDLEWTSSFRNALSEDTQLAELMQRMLQPESRFTSFFVWTHAERWRTLDETTTPPNLVDFDQRWAWVRESVIPLWRRIDGSDPDLIRAWLAEAIDEPLPPVKLAKLVKRAFAEL